MSALTDVLPATARKRVYVAYTVAVVILGAIQVGYATLEAGQPAWLSVALAVAAYLGAALGLTAAANTPAGRHAAPSSVDVE